MKQVGDFKVDTRNAGSGDLKVLIKGPSEYFSFVLVSSSRNWKNHVHSLCVCVFASSSSDGTEEPVKQISSKDGVFCYEYRPSSPGKYSVSITWGGAHIPKR